LIPGKGAGRDTASIENKEQHHEPGHSHHPSQIEQLRQRTHDSEMLAVQL
jgi:hypothetical protein